MARTIPNKPQNINEKICEVSKRMENTENVIEFFCNEHYVLTSTNETKNTVTSLCYRCVGRNQRERPTDKPSKG